MAQFKVKGILSFPHLFQARAVDGSDPKFGTVLLIADNDPQLQTVLQIQEQEKANTFPSGFPATGKVFCKPSADVAGYHQISANAAADKQPHLVDANGAPIMDRAIVYAGAEAWVMFNSFGYDKAMNKGVSAGLNGVLITGNEGALGRLDGRPTVESMFADVIPGGVPAQAAPAAPVQAAPAAPVQAAPAAPVQAAPVQAAPAAPVQAAPVAAPTGSLQMTPAANGVTLEQYLATPGWTEDMLIQQGLAVRTSF